MKALWLVRMQADKKKLWRAIWIFNWVRNYQYQGVTTEAVWNKKKKGGGEGSGGISPKEELKLEAEKSEGDQKPDLCCEAFPNQ